MTRLLLILFFLSGAAMTRAAEAPAARPSLERLAWLAGTWSFEKGGRTVTEQWMAPGGGTMLGMSRTIANGTTVEYEFLLIRRGEKGDFEYVSKPSGQPEASFKLARASDTEAVFENPKHDFPQRISYVLQSDGRLLAAIEGNKNGKFRRVEFPYRRTNPDKTSRTGGHSSRLAGGVR